MYIDSSTNYNISFGNNADAQKLREILSNSTNNLSQSMQRMSSGLKINSAKDDSAGVVISDKMLVELQGNSICQNNIQSANAMLSATSDNLEAVIDNISRIRDLTLQAKNGTYSQGEIEAMQNEAEQLIAEIDRLSENSKYSQLNLFGGDLAQNGTSFQVGADFGEDNMIIVDSSLGIFNSIKFDDITKYSTKEASIAYVNASGVEEEIAGLKLVDEILNNGEIVLNHSETEFLQDDNDKIYYLATGDEKEGFYKISDNGETYKAEEELVYNFKGELKSENALKNIQNAKVGDVYSVNDKVYEYKWNFEAENNGAFSWGELAHSVVEKVVPRDTEIKPYDEQSEDKKFNLIEISKDNDAFETAMNALNGAIDDITSRKSAIGSIQNRLSSAFDTLTTQYSNLTSAKSVISDADIAAEASNFTQNQIIQQVSASLLAQANQSPAIALSLI